ncbi:Flg_hook domain-containing protein [Paraburkholderia tropica]|uniref:flagellar hook-length control protein FliK n=1 Tax=Paraburkholderia tropica TaxID=92647 RepID=UPI001CB1A0FF|nr:flagellar hook-length control protein FliK [Paraburkholderia tropica]CAG9235272.1 Flg_hook domain-containing protein [Paraburkholderia tropica]
MNGIDTSAAALIASRVGALGPTGAQGSAGTAQAGVSALAGGVTALPDAQAVNTPQASAQTELSAVALALDAIIRSGGEATPAVVGRAPVWANPGADPGTNGANATNTSLPLPGLAQAEAALESALLADLAATTELGAGGAANGANAANGGDPTQTAAGTANAQGAQGAALAAQSGPVAALTASLAQTVAQSGLFYESHLAQWLQGQRSPAELADEPQNRLAGSQLPLDWNSAADDIDDVLWTDVPSAAQMAARAAEAAGQARGANGANGTNGGNGANGANGDPGSAASQNGARANALLGDTLLPALHTQAGSAAGVHQALLPVVRQQLDLLATGEFRWTGEAWPGVRLDWSIQQDGYDAHEVHNQRGPRRSADDDTPWRTRLTLALPSLGTVDAELTLTGSALAVRVQASPGGAQQLTAHSEVLRGRIAALGLALAGLSIREIGGGVPGGTGSTGSAEAARAADAYAHHAAQAEHAAASASGGAETYAHASAASASDTHPASTTDWELG